MVIFDNWYYIGRNYVRIYNKNKGCDGSLFKGRFKSILVDKDNYLLELRRYIHRNPLAITCNFKSYKWSSYPAYLNLCKAPTWLNKMNTLKIMCIQDDLTPFPI
jgi:hypothetical protein